MTSKLFFTIGALLSLSACFSSHGMEQKAKTSEFPSAQRKLEDRLERDMMASMEIRKVERASEEQKARAQKRPSNWDYKSDGELMLNFQKMLEQKKEQTAKAGGNPNWLRLNPRLNWLTAPSVIAAPKVDPLSPEEQHYAGQSQYIIQSYF